MRTSRQFCSQTTKLQWWIQNVLLISVHQLESVTNKLGLKISTSKANTVTLKEIDPVRNKIVINNNTMEQINTSSQPDCSILYQHEKVTVTKFLQIMGLITRTLRPSQAQKHTKLKMYNTLTLPIYYTDVKLVQLETTSVEMKFMRRTAKYTWQGSL